MEPMAFSVVALTGLLVGRLWASGLNPGDRFESAALEHSFAHSNRLRINCVFGRNAGSFSPTLSVATAKEHAHHHGGSRCNHRVHYHYPIENKIS